MVLSSDLVSQFVKVTNDAQKPVEETTVYGTIVEYEGSNYVKLDGSELLTPFTTTAIVKAGERVTVMIKNHTAVVTGNITSPSAQGKDVVKAIEAANKISEFEIIVAYRVTTDELKAINATIDNLKAKIAEFDDTSAINADIENLRAEYAKLEYVYAEDVEALNIQVEKIKAKFGDFADLSAEELEALNAEITNLKAYNAGFTYVSADVLKAIKASIDELDVNSITAKYAKIEDLKATNAEVTNLKADVADIDTLIFGTASGDVIHVSFANAVIAQLADAQIKSAMIESISASKITAGDIITNNVRVMSEDGLLLISDETIQISDGSRVRVQIGKDAANDYSINIWDADGNLMFSQGGITDSAIKDAIIRNDMVSDTANISAHKLDIDSLFEEINGSSKTIKSTKIYLDDESQTLDVAFKEMTTDVTDLGKTVSSQGTQISTVQGQISSKVWQQDIDTATNEINTQYSSLEQEVDSISATVAKHTTEIDKKADSTTVTTVSSKVASLETGLSGFQSTVSSTYATKTEIEDIEIGGRNLLRDSAEVYSNTSTTGNHGFWNLALDTYSHGIVIEPNQDYVLSYDWSVDWGTSEAYDAYVGIGLGSIPGSFSKDIIHSTKIPNCDENNTSGRFSIVFSTTESALNGSQYFAMRPVRHTSQTALDGSKWSITNLKLEKGNKATDWTPAPEDIQSGIDSAKAAADAAQATANQNAVDMANIVTDFNADVQNLQTQIDGSITTWFYEVAPTTSNVPAVNWTSVDLKNIHLGDLYYDTITGYCYRWQVQNNAYSWQRITDTDVTKALSDAQAAQDTADQKRRVFYTQPSPPYDKGDLWVQGSNGDILRCQSTKASGQSYNASDWTAASKYTDDSLASTANSNAIAAQNAAANAQSDIDNLEIGGRNYLRNSEAEQYDTDGVKQEFLMTTFDLAPFFDEHGLVEVTLSFDAYVPVAGRVQVYCQNGSGSRYSFNSFVDMTTEWSRYSVTFTPTGPNENFVQSYLAFFGTYDTGRFPHVRKVKLEKGNRATDWTPAPEDIQEEVTELTTRVVNAETAIIQNTEAIGLRATKTEVNTAKSEAISTASADATKKADQALTSANSNTSNLLKNYSTTEQMNAAIQVKAEGITSSVSSTYATLSALSQTNANVATAKSVADGAREDIDGLSIGGTNLLKNTSNVLTEYDLAEDMYYLQFGTDTQLEAGETYTFSVYVEKAVEDDVPINLHIGAGNQGNYNLDLHSWRKDAIEMGKKTSLTYTVTESNIETYKYFSWRLRNEKQLTSIRIKEAKLEKGSRATDWSPAPADMATEADVSEVAATVESAKSRISTTESLIQQLSESIMTLVTDGNGESLMVQTEDGWTFSTGQIQNMIDSASENLNSLTNEMGDVNTTVNALQQAVDDLGVLNDYVKIGTYENEPCIELGESDSDFKLLITNTRIMFMEGSSVPAYINNQSLYIKKAVIEEELQQGEFVWKARSNGNLGLIWKGGNS